jgi:antitoxin PrlF
MDYREARECCSVSAEGTCCRVEALVSIDDRGQMVLPKEIREKAGILAGDKLAIIGMMHDGKLECIALVKVESITEMVTSTLRPVMTEIFK